MSLRLNAVRSCMKKDYKGDFGIRQIVSAIIEWDLDYFMEPLLQDDEYA